MMIAEHPVDKALPALSAPYRMGRTYRYAKSPSPSTTGTETRGRRYEDRSLFRQL